MAELYSNLAESATTVAINNTTNPVTFTITTGDGAKFPAATLGSTDYFHAVVDSGTDIELLRCQRNGDSITADRAQEGTTIKAHVPGVKFAHVLTASSLQSIAAYVQGTSFQTKGDLLTRTASAIVRKGAGADGQVLVSRSTAGDGTGLNWEPPSGGGGAAVPQEPDYTIYKDTLGNYYARNERTATVDYTSTSSLHAVFNPAATALGTGTSLTGEGGLIVLSTPANHIMQTAGPLVMQNQLTLRGPGRGCIVQAITAGNWSSGTLNVPIPMIDAYLKSRVKVEGLTLDCSGFAGTTGLIFEKGTGATGGNDAHSYFLYNEVRGFTVSGIQIGRKSSSGATSTCWIHGCQVVDDAGSSAVGVGFYVGDAHYGWGNNIKMASSNGYPMYVNADSVHVMGESHMVNNSNTNTHALITVVGGGHTRIEGIYFDNLNNFPAVAVNPEGSGASNRTLITNNWCHLTSVNAYPSSPSVFTLNAVNGGCSGIVITGNTGEADTETVRFKSIVGITNPASGAKIQNSLAMYGNSFQHVNAFITANNGPTTGTGSAIPGSLNANMIEASNTGGGSNGTTIAVGP